jgi:3-oxoacyl-[acyl-carrier protein] reductase
MSQEVIVITGASRGIGAAMATALAGPGRIIGINFKSDQASAQTTADAVQAKGGRALLLQADVTCAPAVESMFKKLLDQAGRLDALVCNAGIPFKYGRLAEISADDFEKQWRSQAGAAHLCCRQAVPVMSKQRRGRIVFTISSAVQGQPPAFMPHYVSAKYALWGLAQALAEETAGKGIKVDCLFPPMTETDFIKDFPRPIVDAAKESSPNGKLASPAEIARQLAALLKEPA